ncbi:MAG: diaminopimelate decarboxylase [Deltaproteobacteria bacterium]
MSRPRVTASTSRPRRLVGTKSDPAPPAWLDAGLVERTAERVGTPYFLYSADRIRARCGAMLAAFPEAHIRYAMKANANRAVLETIRDCGLGVDAVSPWEVRLARDAGFERAQILYSGSNPSTDELSEIHRAGATLNLDSLSALERFGRAAPRARVSLRLNLEIGGGHHPHVVTAGPDSKFGLSPSEIPKAIALARKHGLRIVGIHQHVGSGIFQRSLFVRALDRLLDLAPRFPELEFIDAGGGFGVPYRATEKAVDLTSWGPAVIARFEAARARTGRDLALVLEPGRYVVADAGVLVTRVTTVKRTRDRTFIGVDSGMHHLVRPAMYGSYHAVYALRRTARPAERCFVVGPICESGDFLAADRRMPPPSEGHLLVVGNAGAYGYTMASFYNLRARPAECMLDGGKVRVVQRRDTYADVVGAPG